MLFRAHSISDLHHEPEGLHDPRPDSGNLADDEENILHVLANLEVLFAEILLAGQCQIRSLLQAPQPSFDCYQRFQSVSIRIHYVNPHNGYYIPLTGKNLSGTDFFSLLVAHISSSVMFGDRISAYPSYSDGDTSGKWRQEHQDSGHHTQVFVASDLGISRFTFPCSALLAIALTVSANYVLQSLGEEKENRLMEILLSTVSSKQLLTGKLLGRGAAGLLQVLFWAVSMPFLLRLGSATIGGMLSSVQVTPGLLVLGVVYFILGYLLFAVVALAIAAICSTVREAQGIAPLFTLTAVAPFWFISLLMFFPNSPIWVVLSLVPFTAPVLVMLRLGISGVPTWQLIASMAILIASVLGGLWIAAKLLRIYLLMYGKRPRLREIVRALRAG